MIMKQKKYRCLNCGKEVKRDESDTVENIEERLRNFSGCDNPDLEEIGSEVKL